MTKQVTYRVIIARDDEPGRAPRLLADISVPSEDGAHFCSLLSAADHRVLTFNYEKEPSDVARRVAFLKPEVEKATRGVTLVEDLAASFSSGPLKEDDRYKTLLAIGDFEVKVTDESIRIYHNTVLVAEGKRRRLDTSPLPEIEFSQSSKTDVTVHGQDHDMTFRVDL